jgi:uncharacterized protein YdhG (YjbR/CyaY superfamily)
MTKSAEVDAYIAALEPLRRERLAALRSLVHSLYPDVAERIEWKMPVFSRADAWVATASQKSYVSVYLHNEGGAAEIAATDPKLKHGKGCLNIPDRAEVPLAALGPMIRERLA